MVPRLRELAPPQPEGVRRRDSRNLGTTLLPSPVYIRTAKHFAKNKLHSGPVLKFDDWRGREGVVHSFGCTNAWHLIACFFQGAKRVKPSDAKLEYYARNSRQNWKSPTCTHYSSPTICWRWYWLPVTIGRTSKSSLFTHSSFRCVLCAGGSFT